MNNLVLKLLEESDLEEIVLAFKHIGWDKPRSLYGTYLNEQSSGSRAVFIAKMHGKFCGYTTLKWLSDYLSFAEKNIPEIADLNVLPVIGSKVLGLC